VSATARPASTADSGRVKMNIAFLKGATPAAPARPAVPPP
jgi:hypothetical protein